MNKQKTYTIKELRKLHERYIEDGYVRNEVCKVTPFLNWLASQENTEESKQCMYCDVDGSEQYAVVDLDNPENNCKFCGIDHHYNERQEEPVEEVKQLAVITLGDNLSAPRVTQMTDKLNELIRSHNALLKQMKGRPV